MKLLIITNNASRPSFRQRVEIYLDRLAQNGISCHVQQFPSGVMPRRRLFRACRDYDGVLLHKRRLNWIDARQLRKGCKRIIYDFDDAVMINPRSPQEHDRKRSHDFQRTVALADTVIAGNRYLADLASSYNQNVWVIPTGLDLQDYVPAVRDPQDDRIRLVWIGSQSTLPYLKALRDPLTAIGRATPQLSLRIIADEFFELPDLPVEKKRWSLQTQARDLAECDIGLAPLPDDPYTRGKCGFKILQYAAAALPTVASPVGANKDILADRQTGLLAHNPQQWIDQVTTLLTRPDLRQAMGQNAREAVCRRFDVSVLSSVLCQHIKETAGVSSG